MADKKPGIPQHVLDAMEQGSPGVERKLDEEQHLQGEPKDPGPKAAYEKAVGDSAKAVPGHWSRSDVAEMVSHIGPDLLDTTIAGMMKPERLRENQPNYGIIENGPWCIVHLGSEILCGELIEPFEDYLVLLVTSPSGDPVAVHIPAGDVLRLVNTEPNKWSFATDIHVDHNPPAFPRRPQ